MTPHARFGLERLPVVTGVVFALTAAGAVAQALAPGLLDSWQRTPEGLHGDWWRYRHGAVRAGRRRRRRALEPRLPAVLGAIVEQFLAPWQWLACYFGAALTGELAGYAWQPVGAGNSIAVCGLAGALAVALWARTPARRPRGSDRAPLLVRRPAGHGLVAGLFAGLAAGALAQAAWARGSTRAGPRQRPQRRPG